MKQVKYGYTMRHSTLIAWLDKHGYKHSEQDDTIIIHCDLLYGNDISIVRREWRKRAVLDKYVRVHRIAAVSSPDCSTMAISLKIYAYK